MVVTRFFLLLKKVLHHLQAECNRSGERQRERVS